MNNSLKASVILGAIALGCIASAQREATTSPKFFASSERWSYTGTYSVHPTLADAKAGTNIIRSGAWLRRDGAVYAVFDAPKFYVTNSREAPNINCILSNWYGKFNGPDNPNNDNAGFLQMYDSNASNLRKIQVNWSQDLKRFEITAQGTNATYGSQTNPVDYARLWNAGLPNAGGEATKGTYLIYEYSLVAKFANPATWSTEHEMWVNSGNALTIDGSFKGIFQNTSATNPQSNGFYVVNLVINEGNVNWGTPASPKYIEVGDDAFGSNQKN